MTMAQILRDLRTKPTVPIWPHYGAVYGLSRGPSYQAAAEGLARGDAEFLRLGKVIRLVSAVTRKRLGLDEDQRVTEQQERRSASRAHRVGDKPRSQRRA